MMVDEFLEGLLNYLYSKILGMSKEEIAVACAKIRSQLRDPKVHTMYTLYVFLLFSIPGRAWWPRHVRQWPNSNAWFLTLRPP